MGLVALSAIASFASWRSSRKAQERLEQVDSRLLEFKVAPPSPIRTVPEVKVLAANVPIHLAPVEKLEPVKLFYCTPDKKPLLSICKIDEIKVKQLRCRPLNISASKLTQIEGVLQATPSLLTHARIVAGNYMEVIVNGPLAAARSGDALRPIVLGSNGKIIEMAKLKPPTALTDFSKAAALWTIASVIVAQKHLSDMNKKLAEIKGGLDEIRDFLQSERESAIIAALTYLQDQAYPTVMSGDFPTAVRLELEGIERRLIEVQTHLQMEFRKTAEDIRTVGDLDTFGYENTINTIQGKVDGLQECSRQYVLTIKARVACWQVLSVFPEGEVLMNSRRNSIMIAVKSDIISYAEGANKILTDRLSQIDPTFGDKNELKSKKMQALGHTGQTSVFLKNELGSIGQHVNSLSEQYKAINKPVRMAVRLEQGRIIEALELLEA